MGSILQAKCPCGFESGPLFVGTGMHYDYQRDQGKNPEPAICLHCNRLVVANYNSKRPRCSKCRKKLQFYQDDPSLYLQEGDSFDDDRIKHLCPDCGKIEMEFEFSGCWD